MSDDQIFEALNALKNADCGREAGPDVEARVLAAFDRRAKRPRRVFTWAAVAAAAALALALVPAKHSPSPVEAKEVVTPFIPLMAVQPPFERGEVVRVVVPAEMMRDVGLPVTDAQLTGQVEADVLVGQEGLARAIRFVSFQQ
jgi:hypothetical protein